MLAAISTNMRAKTPISDVQDLLAKILADLQAESTTLDKDYEAERASTKDAIDSNSASIESFTQTLNSLEDAIRGYEEEGVAKVQDYASVTAAIESTQGDLSTLISEHETAAQNFDDDIKNLNDAIAACNQALEKMETYQSATGAALIQVATAAKTHLHAFSKKMRHMSKKLNKHGSMYAPLIHELIELTTDVENEKGGKVIELLNQLLNLLTQALADLNNQAGSYQTAFETHKAQDEAAIESYKTQASLDQQRIDEIATQENEALANVEKTKAFIDDASTILENAKAAHKANEEKYSDRRPRL
jgi:chromosome segregation ATPase